MMNKMMIAIIASLAFMGTAFADHHEGEGEGGMEKKPFSIYGDFAGSWAMQSNEHGGAGVGAGGTQVSGAQHDSFAVDLATVNLEKNWSNSKLHLAIGYGRTAAGFNPILAGATLKPTLNLLNGYYAIQSSYGLGFKLGKYDSPMGYESWNIMNNRQYTRSWGYSQVNYFQTGFAVTYDFGKMANVAFHVSNDTQGLDADNNRNKSMTLAVNLTPMDNLAIDINYQTGIATSTAAGGSPAAGNYTDTVMEVSAAYIINEMVDVAIDYTDRTAKPTTGSDVKANSIAAYVNGNFGKLGASLRYEMFKYDATMPNSLWTVGYGAVGTDNSINSITLAVNYDIDQNARVILEHRMDKSSDKIWVDKNGTAGAKDSVDTTTLGLMYRF